MRYIKQSDYTGLFFICHVCWKIDLIYHSDTDVL